MKNHPLVNDSHASHRNSIISGMRKFHTRSSLHLQRDVSFISDIRLADVRVNDDIDVSISIDGIVTVSQPSIHVSVQVPGVIAYTKCMTSPVGVMPSPSCIVIIDSRQSIVCMPLSSIFLSHINNHNLLDTDYTDQTVLTYHLSQSIQHMTSNILHIDAYTVDCMHVIDEGMLIATRTCLIYHIQLSYDDRILKSRVIRCLDMCVAGYVYSHLCRHDDGIVATAYCSDKKSVVLWHATDKLKLKTYGVISDLMPVVDSALPVIDGNPIIVLRTSSHNKLATRMIDRQPSMSNYVIDI